MRRFWIVAVGILAVSGCEMNADENRLAAPQQEAWDETRKEVADTPYLIAGYSADDKEWKTCVYNPTLYNHKWVVMAVDLWSKEDRSGVEGFASDRAKDRGFAAAVVVDLASQKAPQVLSWYYKEGDGLKKSNRAPREDLNASLKKYLHEIQLRPDLVKKPAA